MKASEFKSKSESELRRMKNDFQDKLWNLLYEKSVKKIKNASLIKEIKKDIARINTILISKYHGK